MIHKIKALFDEGGGLSIRAIARRLGISRNTVKRLLRMDVGVLQKRLSDRERHKRLDEHRDYIIHLLQEFPDLSAVKVLKKLRMKYAELEVSGRSMRRYIGRLKQSVAMKPRRFYEPVLNMVPGVQCQVDGGELRGVLIGGLESVIYFVVFVLSYSRLMYAALSSKPVNTEIFIRMHDAAFRYFGGRPEECVYDQTKLVVLHEQYRELELNQQFQAYAVAAGFRIHACEGYDPESKGKVEAGVKYVKGGALYGESFEDWPHLEGYTAAWLNDTANVRIHGSTGESPRQRYERDERRHMGAYLTPDYLLLEQSPHETRKVDKTGLISWKANKYSAPMAYQQGRVGVREEGAHLALCDLTSGREIARHRLSKGKGLMIKNADHYRDKQEKIDALEQDIVRQLGEECGKRLCALLQQTSPRIYKDQLAGLASLLQHYKPPTPLLARLCERTRLTTTQIRDLLEADAARPQRLDDAPADAGNPPPGGSTLIRYAGVARPHQEVDHELLS